MTFSPPSQSPRRRTLVPPLVLPLFLLLLLPPTTAAATTTITGTYLPLSYPISPGRGSAECLYERISTPGEHATASVFVTSGEDMRITLVFEGPVAPIDLDFSSTPDDARGGEKRVDAHGGSTLRGYLNRYEAEGPSMFVNGKFGDAMMNVKSIRVSDLVDFEEGEEEEEEEEKEGGGHSRDHPPPPSSDAQRPPGRHHREAREEGQEESEEEMVDDEYLAREEANIEHLHREAEVDDDFVKLQIGNLKPAPVAASATIVPPKHREGGGGDEEKDANEGRPPPPQRKRNNNHGRRRLSEAIRPPAGDPYERTFLIETPGWYRMCANPATKHVTVEMELRKESTHGRVDSRTGHVPGLEEVEIHSEIRALYEEEEKDASSAPESGGKGGIEDEDLRVTREQLRILERVYSEIIAKQLEERRKWNWRTIKNQHLYSHLVLGNLVETVVYMGITGWQVYTIRKWFGGDHKLGR